MKRVLVVGGAGYIGSVLCRRLLARGYRVDVYDSLLYGEGPLRGLFCDNLSIFQADTRDMVAMTRALKHCDVVIYLGELVSDPICAKFPTETLEINHLAPVNAIRLARHLGVPRFIYMSSCSIYGMSEGDQELHEGTLARPTSTYAEYKLLNEQEIFSDDASQFVVLRLGTVFGPSLRQRLDLVTNLFVALAYFEKHFRVFGADHWRACVHVEDVALALELAACGPSYVCGKAYNIVAENFRIGDIARLVAEKLPDAKIDWNGEGQDVRDYKASWKRAHDILGYRPEHTIREAIDELLSLCQRGLITDPTSAICTNHKWYRGEGHSG